MPLQLAKLTAITQQAIRLSLAMFAIKDDAAFSHVRAADFSNVFVPDSYADTASAVHKSDVTTNSFCAQFGSASAKVWTSDSL